jgi:hypothetical protein
MMMRNLAWAGACGLAGLLAVTACSSGSSAPPSWAAALGSGVTVTAPAQVSPGDGTPGAAVAGVFAAVGAKHYTAECTYLEPSVQADCKSGAAQLTSKNAPNLKNAAIGYTVIHGNEALVGTTGTFCVPGETPECYTNNDPAAILSSGKSFATQWTAANKTSSANAYTLAPCIEVNGKWYLYSSS